MDLDGGDEVVASGRPVRSSSFAGLSLWLVPSPQSEQRSVLRHEMAALRQAVLHDDHDHRMNPSAPFPPHVTLLSSLDAERWSEQAVWHALVTAITAWHQQGGKPLTCALQDIATHGTYFQCIFIALEKTQALMDLNTRMRDAFDAYQQPPYVPHCSLLYAHLTPEETDKRIAKLKKEGIFTPAANPRHRSSTPEDAMSTSVSSSSALAEAAQRIVLGRSRSKELREPHVDTIMLNAIELWDTNGEVGNWRMLRRMPL